MPLYVCATSSLPIAISLIVNGMTLGSAFIFLTAGPATNSVTMGVVEDMFGKRSLAIYIFGVAILSILFGYLLDTISIDLNVLLSLQESLKTPSILDIISTAVMFTLMLYYIFKKDI